MADIKKMFLDFTKEYGLETEVFNGLDEIQIARIRFSGQQGVFVGSAVFSEEDLFVFLVSMGLVVAPEQRAACLERISSVNQKLKLGGFYIDDATGILGYRLTHYILSEDAESRSFLANLTVYAGRVAEQYYPEFAEISSGEEKQDS